MASITLGTHSPMVDIHLIKIIRVRKVKQFLRSVLQILLKLKPAMDVLKLQLTE